VGERESNPAVGRTAADLAFQRLCRQNEQFCTSTAPGIVLDSHGDSSQGTAEILLSIIVDSLAKIGTLTTPKLEEQEQ
jgi:hypothetical protein